MLQKNGFFKKRYTRLDRAEPQVERTRQNNFCYFLKIEKRQAVSTTD